MTTKYGIRHYPSTGVYRAFKDTVFAGIVLNRSWITNDGDIARKQDRMRVCIQLSKEAAMGNIREYFIRHQSINADYTDEYVYKEEWWKNTDISQIVEVTLSVPPTTTYSSLVDHLHVFCHKNKVGTKLTIEIDEYGDTYPRVQVVQGNESLYAEVAILMTAWNKGELE